MEKSEQINELALALSKAQAQILGAKKDATNPFFKSSYADLESCWLACREPLTTNNLAITQLVQSNNQDHELVQIIMHASGQFISSTTRIPCAKPNDPQALGSAISYMRRYCLAAAVGIYQTDDDAEAATVHDYTIQIGPHQGKKLTDLSGEELKKLADSLNRFDDRNLNYQQKELKSKVTNHLKGSHS